MRLPIYDATLRVSPFSKTARLKLFYSTTVAFTVQLSTVGTILEQIYPRKKEKKVISRALLLRSELKIAQLELFFLHHSSVYRPYIGASCYEYKILVFWPYLFRYRSRTQRP